MANGVFVTVYFIFCCLILFLGIWVAMGKKIGPFCRNWKKTYLEFLYGLVGITTFLLILYPNSLLTVYLFGNSTLILYLSYSGIRFRFRKIRNLSPDKSDVLVTLVLGVTGLFLYIMGLYKWIFNLREETPFYLATYCLIGLALILVCISDLLYLRNTGFQIQGPWFFRYFLRLLISYVLLFLSIVLVYYRWYPNLPSLVALFIISSLFGLFIWTLLSNQRKPRTQSKTSGMENENSPMREGSII
jgi:hypothetical protein